MATLSPDVSEAADVGFVVEGDPTKQRIVDNANTKPTGETFDIRSSIHRFLKIGDVHIGSDLQVICGEFSSATPVIFHVHRDILLQKCTFFADGYNFAVVSQRSCQSAPMPVVFEDLLEYDADVVYEFLRFVYSGMVCAPFGDLRRVAHFFKQLLKLIDYLGVFEMAERHPGNPAIPNILDDNVIGNFLERMLMQASDNVTADNATADPMVAVVDEICNDHLLGFQLQRALVHKLLELRSMSMDMHIFLDSSGQHHVELQQQLIDRGLIDSNKRFDLALMGSTQEDLDSDLYVSAR